MKQMPAYNNSEKSKIQSVVGKYIKLGGRGGAADPDYDEVVNAILNSKFKIGNKLIAELNDNGIVCALIAHTIIKELK